MYALSLLWADSVSTLKYLANSALIIAFVVYAIRREKINIGGLLKAITRRK